MSNEKRVDSYFSTFFKVQIDGIETAKFTKCEGLEAETYIYEVEEGGLNTNTHKFLGRTRFPNIVLENGVTDNNDLWTWYKDTVLTEETVQRKDGSIILCNQAGQEVKRWNFFRAIPCKWVGPKLARDSASTAIERIEIAHEGLELDS